MKDKDTEKKTTINTGTTVPQKEKEGTYHVLCIE